MESMQFHTLDSIYKSFYEDIELDIFPKFNMVKAEINGFHHKTEYIWRNYRLACQMNSEDGQTGRIVLEGYVYPEEVKEGEVTEDDPEDYPNYFKYECDLGIEDELFIGQVMDFKSDFVKEEDDYYYD